MTGSLKLLVFTLAACTVCMGADDLIKSTQAFEDVALETNLSSRFWQGTPPVYVEKDKYGNMVRGYRTEIRTRWTTTNLYFLFVCRYE